MLQIHELSVDYGLRSVLRGVKLSVAPGEIVAIVGESGCGKSTLLRAIAGLLPQNARMAGEILLRERDLSALSQREYRKLRGGEIGMIFQDPETSLCPVMKIRTQALDVLRGEGHINRKDAEQRVLELFRRLGLGEEERILSAYPYELSGGMKQRVSLALSMLRAPSLLLADEPTSALDVVNARQVIHMLNAVRQSWGASVLVATHQLAGLSLLADRIAVIHDGRIAECGPARQILSAPKHAYTKTLIAAAGHPVLSGEAG